MTKKKLIVQYQSDKKVYQAALAEKLIPLQATIIANRCQDPAIVKAIMGKHLELLQAPQLLKDCDKAAERLAEAVMTHQSIGILTDYDVDGITSHAIIFYALKDFFHVREEKLVSLIGHRINQGYGISQGLVDTILAEDILPDVIMTADCGSSDEDRIKQLSRRGVDVIVTDHHAIPVEGPPQSAFAVVNPSQLDCAYEDKTIAGCMVAWLVMSRLRQILIDKTYLSTEAAKLSSLLDFVSLGTVADAVSLQSISNRAVVLAGLLIMNKQNRLCWQELAKTLKKENFSVEDLGFQIGPRINARSRMADPYQALYFFTDNEAHKVKNSLDQLNKDNIERRQVEKLMLEKAIELADLQLQSNPYILVIFDEMFHAGVQGIVASRLVDRYGVPAIVLSQTLDAEILSGSARTVEDINIRDCLQHFSEELISFGGHKAAAGLKLERHKTEDFTRRINEHIKSILEQKSISLQPKVYYDIELKEQEINLDTLAIIEQLQPYGRQFESPAFCNEFIIQFYREVGFEANHLSFNLIYKNKEFRSIWFNAVSPGELNPFVVGQHVKVVYQLMKDDYLDESRIQLKILYAQPCDGS